MLEGRPPVGRLTREKEEWATRSGGRPAASRPSGLSPSPGRPGSQGHTFGALGAPAWSLARSRWASGLCVGTSHVGPRFSASLPQAQGRQGPGRQAWLGELLQQAPRARPPSRSRQLLGDLWTR